MKKIKILSWNVNGIRAAQKKGFLEWLQKEKPDILCLQETKAEKEQLDEVRDFYFYYGIAYFALSRSETRDLSTEQKAEHSEKAILNLQESISIASASTLEMRDRDRYFLGLAYWFDLKQEKAISEFHKINPESIFYKKSLGLISDQNKTNL